MRRLSVTEVGICLVVVGLAAITLLPAIARVHRTTAEAKCQSNMQRWVEAIDLYLADNGSLYPSNRAILSNGSLSAYIMPTVALSPEAEPGQPQPRFVHSINWVEALYPYLQSAAEKTDQDWRSFRRCPAASNLTMPTASGYSYQITYVFNRCLVENWRSVARQPRNVMMMRELGRRTMATLRPANDSTNQPGLKPVEAFLIGKDVLVPGGFPTSEYLLHANGSHIMFADGHVRAFDITYFATDPPTYQRQATAYDAQTQQWYNYVFNPPTTPDQEAKNKSIAISP